MKDKFEPKTIIDPFSLLFVNEKGELERIHCPFLARCRIPIADLVYNEVYTVDMVQKELKNFVIYIINGKPYLHHHFEILL